MDTETLEKATTPFFTTKDVGKRTGLGLSLVQGVVAQTSGHLHLISALDHGTTVQLYLPVATGIETFFPDTVETEGRRPIIGC